MAAPASPIPAVSVDPLDIFGQLISLTPADLINVRNKWRALNGSREVVSFSGSVSGNGALALVSTKIPVRFALDEIEATFEETGADDLKVYFLVSKTNAADSTGLNVLSKYSPQAYLTGQATTIKAKLDPAEYQDGQYLKVYATNGSGSAINLNARIRIKVYPIIPQANS